MNIHEIRDPAEARRFLAQGAWLGRLAAPSAATAARALGWALELASGGEPIPPVGVIADLGGLALDGGRDRVDGRKLPEVPGWPTGLFRAYEDLVLGKLDADGSMARGSAALARYRGRDRSRGLAFLIGQLRARAGFGGVLLNPAAIKAALEAPADGLLPHGWDSIAAEGPMPILPALYEEVVAAVRDAPEALGPEDVFELEHRTALAEFAQRVAVRQVVRAAADFEAGIGIDRPRPSGRRQDVASRVVDEDTYPVGGFSSISTRGAIESLLHSQLVYMEPGPGDRPDLFDIKYVRDELLYYSRDENQFFRRRRTYLIVLDPGLVLARVKDAGLPLQGVVLLLGLLVAAARRLTDWLGDESILFEFLFPAGPDGEPLAAERALVEAVLREAIVNGTVATDAVASDQLAARFRSRARRGLALALVVDAGGRAIEVEGAESIGLRIDGPRPRLEIGDGTSVPPGDGDALSSWRAALDGLLAAWA